MSIPVLNGEFLRSGDRRELVNQFAKSYSEVGFAYLENHGIPQPLVDQVFDANRQFHLLPEVEKQKIALDDNHRGYIAIDTSTDVNSTLAEVTKPNQSASFMMMSDSAPDPKRYLSGRNQWPQLTGFRETLESYHLAMCDLAHALTKVALDACGAPGDAIQAFDRPTTWLRLLHYPPSPINSPDDLYGSAPHTDFGALTILAQDAVGGLQVQTTDGAWIDVPPRPGSYIVNVGDMLHRMSNGFFRSTPHRVINRSGRERYSVPFFYDPDVAYQVAPLPGLGDPKFPPVQFGEFLRSELEASYDTHKSDDGT